MIVSLVRFRSNLGDDEVQAAFEDRAERYRSVPGLVEKIYLRFPEIGEFGALYVWDSPDSLERFRESDLARTIPSVYEVDGAPRSELADVRLIVEGSASRAGVGG
jgi:heme-degrading monooxygenase HmoA